MMQATPSNLAIWSIAIVATLGVLVRPWRSREFWWAVGGAAALVICDLLPIDLALHAVGKGLDVYLFLAGMMLLSELARREGVFDFLAGWAVGRARGSASRLFALVYGIGTLVTVFMSNDATAVVLTPAVFAVARKAGAKPLPYLLACAFVANAASFVLPISNPANLVIFGAHLPPLFTWLVHFALPSALSILATFYILRWMERDSLTAALAVDADRAKLTSTGKMAAMGILLVAAVLLVASALDKPLGLPTAASAALVALIIFGSKREAPWTCLAEISWSVLALVAGLFVLVAGLAQTGLLQSLSEALRAAVAGSETLALFGVSGVVAIACNLINNLPAGLIAGSVVAHASVSPTMQSAIAIGVDLGPNLSITGSLATLLWLIAIRREGENVTAWQFLRYGAVAMPVALALALLGLWAQALLQRAL